MGMVLKGAMFACAVVLLIMFGMVLAATRGQTDGVSLFFTLLMAVSLWAGAMALAWPVISVLWDLIRGAHLPQPPEIYRSLEERTRMRSSGWVGLLVLVVLLAGCGSNSGTDKLATAAHYGPVSNMVKFETSGVTYQCRWRQYGTHDAYVYLFDADGKELMPMDGMDEWRAQKPLVVAMALGPAAVIDWCKEYQRNASLWAAPGMSPETEAEWERYRATGELPEPRAANLPNITGSIAQSNIDIPEEELAPLVIPCVEVSPSHWRCDSQDESFTPIEPLAYPAAPGSGI